MNNGLVPAELVKIGDRLLSASHGWVTVDGVSNVRESGLFNPQTMHGDIVVDGFVASTYTETVPRAVASGLLAPFRFLFDCGLINERRFGSFLVDGYRSLLPTALEP